MIKLNNIYNYKNLNRIDSQSGRLYDTPSGKLPSVTTILSKTKSVESVEKLATWRKRVGDDEATRITKEAGNVGTLMHSVLEHWILNQEHDIGNNMIHQQAKRMAEVVKKNIAPHISEVWGSEVQLYYPDLYAGTTDVVGIWKGQPAIIDFKQSNKVKRREWIDDYFNQLASYAMAHNELYGTNITQGVVAMCTRDCEFQLFEISGNEFEYWSTEWANRLAKFYDK